MVLPPLATVTPTPVAVAAAEANAAARGRGVLGGVADGWGGDDTPEVVEMTLSDDLRFKLKGKAQRHRENLSKDVVFGIESNEDMECEHVT